jgi:hypothetical protein
MQWTRFIERKTTFNENYGTCRQAHREMSSEGHTTSTHVRFPIASMLISSE